jgi:hypothetical protein
MNFQTKNQNYSQNTTEQNIAQMHKTNYKTDNENITGKTIESFRKDVVQYNEVEKLIKTLQNQIKPLQEAMKGLKVEKKELEKDLTKFMGSKGVGHVNLPVHGNKNGVPVDYKGEPCKAIKYSVTEAVIPITKDIIKDSLIRFFSGEGSSEKFKKLSIEEKGLRAYDFIYEKKNRQTKTKETLRKVKYQPADIEKEMDIEVPIMQ